MKNSFTALGLMLAAAFPVAFIIELAGIRLPAIVDSVHLFGAFMLTFLFKIVFADYARHVDTALENPAAILELPAQSGAKSALRLAA